MIVIAAFTKVGAGLCCKLAEILNGKGYVPERCLLPGLERLDLPLHRWAEEHFSKVEALVFIGAAGIAVRAVAPLIQSKGSDPAVLCVDERGDYVIPLLSGHIGGGNELARRIAGYLGGTAVITTATDVQGTFSPDDWAARNGCVIPKLSQIKAVSAALLEGRPVGVVSDFPLDGAFPQGLVPNKDTENGILLSLHEQKPFPHTLWIVPRCLCIGIGCRKNTSAGAIRDFVLETLSQSGFSRECVLSAATIDLKKNEPGLLEFCGEWKLPLEVYSPKELGSVQGSVASSAFVKGVTGVDNVCERSALAGGGRLLIPKTAQNGVTVAVAIREWRATFDG